MKTTIVFLLISNVFMTFAWYGHLKHKNSALWVAIIVSWLIAFVEYCFQVPANRIGHNSGLTAAQLKIIQEIITLVVFCVFSVLWLDEQLKWNYFVGFGFILLAVFFVFMLNDITFAEFTGRLQSKFSKLFGIFIK